MMVNIEVGLFSLPTRLIESLFLNKFKFVLSDKFRNARSDSSSRFHYLKNAAHNYVDKQNSRGI